MKWMLTGVAALALAASGAMAQPGGGNGNGNGGGNGGGRPAAERPDRAPAAQREERGNQGQGQARQAAARDNGPPANRGNDNATAGREQRGNERAPAAVARGNDRAGPGNGAVTRDRNNRGPDNRDWREPPLRYIVRDDRGPDRAPVRYLGALDGCPPGLAAKNNGCQPPGQARKTDWLVRDRYDLGWWGLPRYDSGYYRYDNGYLLRLGDGGLVSGFIPLLGGALAVGNPWPQSYGYDRLDPYYADYYGLGPSYRYADNVVYRVDPQTSLISSIAALLTGDEFTVGSPLPTGYDVYNVPYDYRDRYYDTDDAWYRYSDGYVYEVDPTTQLIRTAIELLA